MKISELSGAMLALWVARCDPKRRGIRWQRERDHWVGFGRIGSSPEFACWIITDANEAEREKLRGHLYAKVYAPHEDWAQGGPIIDDYAIGFQPLSDAEWEAEEYITGFTGRGPTPLVAAMRAYVASIYGNQVPDDAAHHHSAESAGDK